MVNSVTRRNIRVKERTNIIFEYDAVIILKREIIHTAINMAPRQERKTGRNVKKRHLYKKG